MPLHKNIVSLPEGYTEPGDAENDSNLCEWREEQLEDGVPELKANDSIIS